VEFPHGHPIGGVRSAPRFTPAAARDNFPGCRVPVVPVDPAGRPPSRRDPSTCLPPRRWAGRHQRLPANYRPRFRPRSGKLSRSRRLPELRAPPGRGRLRSCRNRLKPDCSRDGRCERDPFPNGPRPSPEKRLVRGRRICRGFTRPGRATFTIQRGLSAAGRGADGRPVRCAMIGLWGGKVVGL
jgi:hypothetical protein